MSMWGLETRGLGDWRIWRLEIRDWILTIFDIMCINIVEKIRSEG